VDEIVRRTLEGVTPGSIVLLHDGDGYNPDGDRKQTAAGRHVSAGPMRQEPWADGHHPDDNDDGEDQQMQIEAEAF
jgi:hypothetical protein